MEAQGGRAALGNQNRSALKTGSKSGFGKGFLRSCTLKQARGVGGHAREGQR